MSSFKFSNFQILSIPIKDHYGIEYPTVEHAYQAAKSFDEKVRKKIAALQYPGQAKKYGRKITVRPDWERVKDGIMLHCIRHKFSKCSEHKNKLLSHKGNIVETNYWHDNYWGVCVCNRCHSKGQNKLGIMLMKIRDEEL